jgi:hypothetical protein
MHTEHLHQTLSPQAYAALQDGFRRQAEQDRRRAFQSFGPCWPGQLWQRVQGLRLPAVVPGHPQKA